MTHMNLSDRLKFAQEFKNNDSFIWEQNVNVKMMRGNVPIVFKILPSYPIDKTEYKGSTEWVPFRLPPEQDDTLTCWANIIYVSRFLGHGDRYPGRMDIVSPLTFARSEDMTCECPLFTIYNFARSNTRWSYLTERRDDTLLGRPILAKPVELTVMNIIDINEPAKGVQLGVFTATAANSFFNPKGIAMFRNRAITPEMIQENYLSKWYLGDFTDPTYGVCFELSKTTGKGNYSSYTVIEKETADGLMTYPISDELLKQRYDLANIETYVKETNNETVIADLVKVLNGTNPNTGEPEYNILKMAFPNYADLVDETAKTLGFTKTATASPTPSSVRLNNTPANIPSNTATKNINSTVQQVSRPKDVVGSTQSNPQINKPNPFDTQSTRPVAVPNTGTKGSATEALQEHTGPIKVPGVPWDTQKISEQFAKFKQ